jgi:FkbM family methyltransferase
MFLKRILGDRIPPHSGIAESVLRCSIAYNRHGGYCVPSSSRRRPAARKILSGGIWEPETIEYMSAHCGKGDIVHAGAYFGDFIPALSRACASGATIWAFEPNPENYRCALVTTFINELDNVVVTHAGLGARTGWLTMVTSDRKGRPLGGASRIVENRFKEGKHRYAEVQIVRIDDVVPADRQIDILQLDVEGFEQSALAGAAETLRRCRPTLILETAPEEAWLSENILPLGYRITGKAHDNVILTIE